MSRLHIVAASLLLALTICPAHASVEATLDLLPTGSSEIAVALKYTNNGAHPAFIRAADIPQTMPDGRLWNNAFQVVSSTGEVARYTGVIVNLTMEARSEVLTLHPGQMEIVQVNISSNYLLEPDTDYELTPRGFEQSSLPDPSAGQSAGSPTAPTVFTSSPTLRVRTGRRTVGIDTSAGLKNGSPEAACPPDKILAVAAAMSASAKLARDARDYVEGLYGLDLSPDLARTARDVASDHAYGYEYFADNLDSQN